jgi:hypothetical protein
LLPEPVRFEAVALVTVKSLRVRPVTGWEKAAETVKGPLSVGEELERETVGAGTAAVPVTWTLSKVAEARTSAEVEVRARPTKTVAGRLARVVVETGVQAVPLAEAKAERVLPERTRRTLLLGAALRAGPAV